VDTKIKFLTDMGANEVSHSGRTLLQHLIEVYNILKLNGAPQHVCDAGLFHSIYGTSKFKHQTTNDREAVRGVIGARAERLVYEFSILERPRTYHIGELVDGELRKELTMLNGANQIDMNNNKKTPEMTMEEAYGHIGYDSGRT
tara:strand:- start:21 stop:452 length:432 start_codon:yes stop_codon:yes gene_type:complete